MAFSRLQDVRSVCISHLGDIFEIVPASAQATATGSSPKRRTQSLTRSDRALTHIRNKEMKKLKEDREFSRSLFGRTLVAHLASLTTIGTK
jgi:hypothetical protein